MRRKLFSLIAILLTLCICGGILSACNTSEETTNGSQAEVTTAVEETSQRSETDADDTEPPTDSETDTEVVTETETETETETDDGILRFGVMSDTHIGDPNIGDNAVRGFEALQKVSSGKLDLMLFAGDLTNTTAGDAKDKAQIKKFHKPYEKLMPGVPFLFCLGSSHDVPYNQDGSEFRKLFMGTLGNFDFDLDPDGYLADGVRHAVVEDYHFFTLDYGPSEAGVARVLSEIEALTREDPDRPIFVMMHAPDPYAEEHIDETDFAPFPQVIVFAGHTHNSLAREDSIKQDLGFTQLHCGGNAYYRVDGYHRFRDDPYLNLGDIYRFAQELYVEVDGNTVTVTRVDGYNDAIIGEPWVISPDRRDVYTNARIGSAAKCSFEEDALLQITENKEKSSITVNFDAAKMGDGGPALYYRVQLVLRNKSGNYEIAQKADLGSQQVFYPNDEGIPKGFYEYTFENVSLQDYAVVVTAKDCWQYSENALIYLSDGCHYVYSGKTAGQSKVTQ